MRDYVLSCCSTADLSREHFEQRDIPFVCYSYLLDGTEYPDDLGRTMPFAEFYGRLAGGAVSKTSQVNEQVYREFFEGFLKQGVDVLHISLSSGISGSCQTAKRVAGELAKSYPEQKIRVVDSLGASSGYGLLVELLADERDRGADYERLWSLAEDIKLKIHHWFFSTDLTAYVTGGRITRAAGWIGQLIHLCPLLNMDAQGRLVPREKIRTEKRVTQAIVEKMRLHAEGGCDYGGKCYISNSDCPELALEVARLVERDFPHLDGRVLINSVGTVIGSHTGRGTVALFFVGDRRADDPQT